MIIRQVKLILPPKQRAKPAASRTRTCTNAAVCIASRECPSRFWHRADNESVSGHAKMPPTSYQVSATSLKLLIQQIHPRVRVEPDSGMCVARDLYELWGRSPYTLEKQKEAKLGRGAAKQRRAKLAFLTGIKQPRWCHMKTPHW